MSYPSPATALGRFLWHSCVIGDFAFPAMWPLGAVVVTVESKQHLDAKKAAGKHKAKMTQQGRDPNPVTIKLEGFDRDGHWDLTEDALTAIDPNSAGTGGPYLFSHPDANRRATKWIMIEKVHGVVWQGTRFSVQIDGIEWDEPKRVALGGATKTPKSGKDWVNAPVSGGVSIGDNNNKVGGFHPVGDGSPPPNGPTAKKNPYNHASNKQAPNADP